MMKAYFSSGLAILLPIVLTVMIVFFLIDALTNPFLAFTQSLLTQSRWIQHSFPHLNDPTVMAFISKILILIALGSFIVLIGLFGEHVIINTFLRLGDKFMHKLPIVNKIYKTSQDAVHGIFSGSSKNTSQVVFVPFPQPKQLSLGLATANVIKIENCPREPESFRSVFVPGTPNPSVGFMLLFKKEQLLPVDMSTDAAMKLIVSCGAVATDFTVLPSLSGPSK